MSYLNIKSFSGLYDELSSTNGAKSIGTTSGQNVQQFISAHNHSGGDNGVKIEWNNIINKPTTFTPATHTHGWTEITNRPMNPIVASIIFGG